MAYCQSVSIMGRVPTAQFPQLQKHHSNIAGKLFLHMWLMHQTSFGIMVTESQKEIITLYLVFYNN